MEWKNLIGTIRDTFRVGYNKLVIDASGLTQQRTVVIPDRSGDLTYLVFSEAAPSDPFVGMFWWCTFNGQLYVRYHDGTSEYWVTANSGIKGDTGEQGIQGEQGDSGLVGVWQGNWSAGEYQELDVVRHDNAIWIATAITTQEPSDEATEWDILFGGDFLNSINTWTAPQRASVVTDNDGSFDMDAAQHFLCTPAATVELAFTNVTVGQSGIITLDNSGGEVITIDATTIECPDTTADDLSIAGKYAISYHVPNGGTKAVISYSEALA